MNKAELIEKIASEANMTKVQSNKTINSFTLAMVASLKKGQNVTLAGFGTFYVTTRAGCNGRNPKTGLTIKLKACKVAKFKAGKELSESINNKI